MNKTKIGMFFICFGGWLPAAFSGTSEYLGNHQRTGYVDARIPAEPVLLWSYEVNHAPRHAWTEPMREVQHIDFDYADHTAMDAERCYFGSSADHTVRALDIATGQEQWRFHAQGPVRFAPVVASDRVYAVSDDGFLYCLESRTGELVWTFRGGPTDDKLMGNEQMISRWPARSGVILDGDKLYFAAGMWSREGIFLYCLNAADGSVIWRNDTSGFWFADMPHGDGFGGVSPQGPMLLHKDVLILPCGRALPAAFNAKTGKLMWHENDYEKNHHPGSSWLVAADDYVICKRRSRHAEAHVSTAEYDPPAGAASGLMGLNIRTGEAEWALTDKDLAAMRGSSMVLAGWGETIRADLHDVVDRVERIGATGKPDPDISTGTAANIGKRYAQSVSKPARVTAISIKKWSADIGRVYTMLIVGDVVIAGGREKVTLVDFKTGTVLWTRQITGNARGISAVDGRFVVSSSDGTQYCFGAGKMDSGVVVRNEPVKPAASPEARETAKAVVEAGGITEGYCLMLGSGGGPLLFELIDQTDLTVFCVEPDKVKAAGLRETLSRAGMLGARAVVFDGSFDRLPFNPYFANLILWGDPLGSGFGELNGKDLYKVLRPYGGTAVQLSANDSPEATRKWLVDSGVPESEVSDGASGLLVKRGRLPKTRDWSHPYANIGRTFSSEDEMVQLPLGLLWFGGVGPERIISRHWRSPIPVFSGGIMYVQGEHDLIAVDAYNGRELWSLPLQKVGRYPSSGRGGNIVADENHVYCIQDLSCLQIDHAGQVVKKYTYPLGMARKQMMLEALRENVGKIKSSELVWEYLGVTDRHIIGTLGSDSVKTGTASKFIYVFDKKSGTLLWTHTLDEAVNPMAIVADNNVLYFLDRTFEATYQKMKRRGLDDFSCSLNALNLDSGQEVWPLKELPLSAKGLMMNNGVIVTGPIGAENYSDLYAPIYAYSATTGEELWKHGMSNRNWNSDRGQFILYQWIIGDTIFLPEAYDLQTGELKRTVINPMTGDECDFGVYAANFCTTVSAAKNVVTYRAASVAFQEVDRYSGTYWYPEVRPSCWSSVIFAGGLALAPEGSSTCSCPYNYKTSMALYPVERQESWSLYMTQYPNSDNGQTERAANASGAKKNAAEKPKRGREGVPILDVQAALPDPDLKPIAASDGPIRNVRINLGVLGDRMDDRDRLWIGYPKGNIDSLKSFSLIDVPVEHEGAVERFEFNADWHPVSGTEIPWLYTHGLTGEAEYVINLPESRKAWTVVLHFSEISGAGTGRRIFDVLIEGKTVVPRLDILKDAGGKDAALVKTFNGIRPDGDLEIELRSVRGGPPLLCAFEVIEE